MAFSPSLHRLVLIRPDQLAFGAGAASRQAIGTAVSCGMIGSTCLGLVFTPALYVAITGVVEHFRKPQKQRSEDRANAALAVAQ